MVCKFSDELQWKFGVYFEQDYSGGMLELLTKQSNEVRFDARPT